MDYSNAKGKEQDPVAKDFMSNSFIIFLKSYFDKLVKGFHNIYFQSTKDIVLVGRNYYTLK